MNPSHHVARGAHPGRHPHDIFHESMSFGERLADRVAAIGGSWSFIMTFGVLLAIWALLNTVVLAQRAFDPYPFIFLNLILSMLAALQAPIIMMSQNRQAVKDRFVARLDYEINQRAEAQIAEILDELQALRRELRERPAQRPS